MVDSAYRLPPSGPLEIQWKCGVWWVPWVEPHPECGGERDLELLSTMETLDMAHIEKGTTETLTGPSLLVRDSLGRQLVTAVPLRLSVRMGVCGGGRHCSVDTGTWNGISQCGKRSEVKLLSSFLVLVSVPLSSSSCVI